MTSSLMSNNTASKLQGSSPSYDRVMIRVEFRRFSPYPGGFPLGPPVSSGSTGFLRPLKNMLLGGTAKINQPLGCEFVTCDELPSHPRCIQYSC